MVVGPKTRGFICTTAHPAGCAANVARQIEYVREQPRFEGVKKALIIGCSTGYGLSTRIAAAFGAGASTLGVAFERPASRTRTATAGWYNTAAFESFAGRDGLYAKTVMGDAFSDAVKEQIIDLIRSDLGKVDLVVYSLAAPRRAVGDVTYNSVLKPVGQPFTSKSLDVAKMEVDTVTIEPATQEEIDGTVKVMGGEDWRWWIDALREADVLAKDATTIAYSYIGPELTYPVYHDGTVGLAKRDLAEAAKAIDAELRAGGGHAYVSVNKALVTQASAAIPVVPLYISILFKIMKEQGTHEGCMEQMYRLLARKLYVPAPELDAEGFLRMDDWELAPAIQEKVNAAWQAISNENLKTYADLEGYRREFYQLFGFEVDEVDYTADVEIGVDIPSIGSAE
ncbi:enoyl-ACP reductase FabV [Ethanoligenens harbinense]|uniref:Trans-2-enoyl-CoA reductase [NADH] n=1 Tax=Ethanoligenens harbinense (strain DSM 18485 / JCM 12961 / CGMCC 1.5033 / YUAN-3) TaxID=663278 RepID=E6U895_ETHHY|nr:enoyl-ACP reductase FabV [Ethanoligenens harbinense]ADU27114.1 Trans-2-enoyl-CoA reductase (NAD(+)) [Ethanoligenens harbinense YUAN-3]AVQ96189.1 enoyl-[acyl-carrier-protein] reductase FabV [Ethanoligenens harbinense YUAN-3]AYF38849.1 enoyl-[acyl-carrier-protein] reductase FabV [Ethanoligenens harbinense]AYF41599.1 enoyl-[acyl-carrier-protein] reductase FabV [Ethanoligenens harbinense]QCN92430.1 trans-2-enoyl-CoA reductase family protein [Ethanoligenens harbinense]